MAAEFSERAKISPEAMKSKKVSVVYYLSRNGQLDHPHFMEVALSSNNGLFLRDVINRLNVLRGKGMASLYSWSSKRSYKNGFVWHDLAEDDLIYATHGQEYVLKGSELLRSSTSSETVHFLPVRRTNTAGSSIDLGEYRVYKNEMTATDVATQTGENRQRQSQRMSGTGDVDEDGNCKKTELSLDDTSPPPSSSSSEGLEPASETFAVGGRVEHDRAPGCASRRLRASASAVLMHLISCGSIPMKINGDGYSMPPHGRPPLQRELGAESDRSMIVPNISAVRLEEREYFSGSLLETKKKSLTGNGAAAEAIAPALKRSSSYNAERRSMMGMDGDGGGGRIPAVNVQTTARVENIIALRK